MKTSLPTDNNSEVETTTAPIVADMTTMATDTTKVEKSYVMGPNDKGIEALAGLLEIPCIFCRSYQTPIGFDLALHLQECHRMDLVKNTHWKRLLLYRGTSRLCCGTWQKRKIGFINYCLL